MRKSVKNQINRAERWGKKNLVRCQLKDDIVSGRIPNNMPAEQAWECRAVYKAIDKDLFILRLKGMREIMANAKARANRDTDALLHDQGIHPKQKYDLQGNSNWAEHPARFLLEVNLDDQESAAK